MGFVKALLIVSIILVLIYAVKPFSTYKDLFDGNSVCLQVVETLCDPTTHTKQTFTNSCDIAIAKKMGWTEDLSSCNSCNKYNITFCNLQTHELANWTFDTCHESMMPNPDIWTDDLSKCQNTTIQKPNTQGLTLNINDLIYKLWDWLSELFAKITNAH